MILLIILSISIEHDNKPAIIFFDDIDRCLPDEAIQVLKSLKNLFLTPECKCIFICGIDNSVIRQLISNHYDMMGETFAINYFRKIFDLIISVPSSPDINRILIEYIKELYDWDDPTGQKAEALAIMIKIQGAQAQISNMSNYFNILNNFFTFQKFNPAYEFNIEADVAITLLIMKEAWQPLYETIMKGIYRNPEEYLIELSRDMRKEKLLPEQVHFLMKYFFGSNAPFRGLNFANFISNYTQLT